MRKIKYIIQNQNNSSLNLSKWKEVLREAYSLGFNNFFLKIVSDIEPQKLKDFLILLSDFNFFIELEYGGIWTEEKKKIFLNSDVDIFWLSFYGLNPKTHDELTGKNDFQTLLEKIDFLASKNLTLGFRYILTKQNFEEVFGLPEFLKNIKYLPHQIIVEEISPLEKRFFKKEYLITPEQLKLYLPYLKKLILDPEKKNSLEIYSNYQNTEHYPFLSGEEIVVEDGGGVRAFPFFSSRNTGNVFSEPFLKVHDNLIKELNKLTEEKAKKGLFLNWSSVIPDHPKLEKVKFHDIDRVILPDTLSVLMTKKCNFECDFCEFDCKLADREAIDIRDFEKLLLEGKKLGIKKLVFDGGEPLVHPEIRKAFKIAGDLGYYSTLLTNGWYFEDFLEDFKKNNINEFIFGLYGASAKTHDKITRKEGAFERCISAIKAAKRLGCFVGLHTVLHPLNFKELDEFLDLAEKYGAEFVMVSKIVPIGRAKNNQKLILKKNQLSKIPGIYYRHESYLSKINFYGYRLSAQGGNLSSNCKYLEKSGNLSIHWDGSVSLCSMVPLLNLPFFKIKDHSLIDCLIFMNKVSEFFQKEANREFSFYRDQCVEETWPCLYCHQKLPKEMKKYVDEEIDRLT
jgi:MoaA/NifB/PqqE/SkfB family radical SAM enzyme